MATRKEPSKMTTLAEIKAQMEELKKLHDAMVNKDKLSIIEDIKLKIADYNITAVELGFKEKVPVNKPIAQSIAEATTKTPVAPKYKSPDGQKTWTGRGISPKWITEYIATGGNKDELLINK